jgi:hypothetical protein
MEVVLIRSRRAVISRRSTASTRSWCSGTACRRRCRSVSLYVRERCRSLTCNKYASTISSKLVARRFDLRCTEGLPPCVTVAACWRAAARAASRLTADTSPRAMRRVRLCSSLYWKTQERRPDPSARMPKPLQLASQKNTSPLPGGHRIFGTLTFVKAPGAAARFRSPVRNRITSADGAGAASSAYGSTVEAEDIVDIERS